MLPPFLTTDNISRLEFAVCRLPFRFHGRSQKLHLTLHVFGPITLIQGCIESKASWTLHIIRYTITAAYEPIAVVRILVISIWFSSASDWKETQIGKSHNYGSLWKNTLILSNCRLGCRGSCGLQVRIILCSPITSVARTARLMADFQNEYHCNIECLIIIFFGYNGTVKFRVHIGSWKQNL